MYISNATSKLRHGYMKLDGGSKGRSLSPMFQRESSSAISRWYCKESKGETEEGTAAPEQIAKVKVKAITCTSEFNVSGIFIFCPYFTMSVQAIQLKTYTFFFSFIDITKICQRHKTGFKTFINIYCEGRMSPKHLRHIFNFVIFCVKQVFKIYY